MSVAKALAARAITFLLDGLQGPTNRESREILEQALADSELRREREVREAELRRASEVTGLGQELAEAVRQRDEARGAFRKIDDLASDVRRLLGAKVGEGTLEAAKRVVAERDGAIKSCSAERTRGDNLDALWSLAHHLYDAKLEETTKRAEAAEARLAALTAPVDGEPSDEALAAISDTSLDRHASRLALWRAGAAHERVRTAQLRAEVSEARADRDKALAELEAANARAEKAEARLARLRTIGVYVSDDGTIVDVRDDLRARLETAESQLSLRVQVGDIVVRNSADASKVEALRERIRELEADLAAARARIAELEAPLPEATVEELVLLGEEAMYRMRGLAPYITKEAKAAAVSAIVLRLQRERPQCLIARAVAANIDVRVAEDQGGGFLVAAHRAGEDEDVERNVPAAEVPATLARLLSEVGA